MERPWIAPWWEHHNVYWTVWKSQWYMGASTGVPVFILYPWLQSGDSWWPIQSQLMGCLHLMMLCYYLMHLPQSMVGAVWTILQGLGFYLLACVSYLSQCLDLLKYWVTSVTQCSTCNMNVPSYTLNLTIQATHQLSSSKRKTVKAETTELHQSYHKLINVLNSNIIDLMLCTSVF